MNNIAQLWQALMAQAQQQQQPQQFQDTISPQERARIGQQTYQQQNSMPFRNVGPNNLLSVPDRNMGTPEDLMNYRAFNRQFTPEQN